MSDDAAEIMRLADLWRGAGDGRARNALEAKVNAIVKANEDYVREHIKIKAELQESWVHQDIKDAALAEAQTSNAKYAVDYQYLQAELAEAQKDAERYRRAGSLMANLCYNGAQMGAMPQPIRNSMNECRKIWDAAIARKGEGIESND